MMRLAPAVNHLWLRRVASCAMCRPRERAVVQVDGRLKTSRVSVESSERKR